MTKEQCILVVISLVVGFLLGRWKKAKCCGNVIVSEVAETCTFRLEIPPDDIPRYREVFFRVVRED